jgi:hypothetical protein
VEAQTGAMPPASGADPIRLGEGRAEANARLFELLAPSIR